jgi:hypothetical protein
MAADKKIKVPGWRRDFHLRARGAAPLLDANHPEELLIGTPSKE